MHKQQIEFLQQVQRQFPHFFESKEIRVLEIGSRNVNGSCRPLFNSMQYVGLDLIPGEGVDFVCHAKDFICPDASFDVVVSCEALEHDAQWKETLRSAYRILIPGGLLVLTCAGVNRPEHGTRRTTPQDSPATLDYYENRTPEDLLTAFEDGRFVQCLAMAGNAGQDSYFWGIKL